MYTGFLIISVICPLDCSLSFSPLDPSNCGICPCPSSYCSHLDGDHNHYLNHHLCPDSHTFIFSPNCSHIASWLLNVLTHTSTQHVLEQSWLLLLCHFCVPVHLLTQVEMLVSSYVYLLFESASVSWWSSQTSQGLFVTFTKMYWCLSLQNEAYCALAGLSLSALLAQLPLWPAFSLILGPLHCSILSEEPYLLFSRSVKTQRRYQFIGFCHIQTLWYRLLFRRVVESTQCLLSEHLLLLVFFIFIPLNVSLGT